MAASEFSFDIVSRVDMMEVKNATDQAQRELAGRYDFKGSKAEIVANKESLTLTADDDFKLSQLRDIVESKMIKRGVDRRHFDYSTPEPASGVSLRQELKFKAGISQDVSKPLIKQIKDKGFKVQAQIQGEEVRVTSKSKDDLQKVIQFVKGLELAVPVDFVNFR